jgi:hypothetical protein
MMPAAIHFRVRVFPFPIQRPICSNKFVSVLCGNETRPLVPVMSADLRGLRAGCSGECLDMRHKTEEEDGENCLKGNLIIFIPHQIVFKTFRSRKMAGPSGRAV